MSDSKQQETKPDDARHAPQDSREAAAGPAHEGSQMRAAGASAQAAPGSAGMGNMQRAEQFGADAAHAGRDALRGAVSTTEEVGTGIVGGASHIATDLVHGVTDLGYEVRNGATGLIGAVGDIGSAAVNTVAGLLVDVVGGVRQVVSAAFQGPDGPIRQGGPSQMRQVPDQGRPPAARPRDEPRA